MNNKEQVAQEILNLLVQFISVCEGLHRWAAVALQYEVQTRLEILRSMEPQEEIKK